MKFVPDALVSKASMATLQASKHSPTLMFSAGVVGVVGTAVLASRATLKLDGILADAAMTQRDISQMEHPNYSEDDRKKDKIILITQTVVKIGKIYGPTVVVGVASIGLLAGSHRLLTKRNAALTAAYAAIDKGFREYRSRVVDDLGEESDRKYLYGGESDTEKSKDKDGKTVKLEKKVGTRTTAYGKLFNESNQNWSPVPEYNFIFLRGIQNMANDRLRAKGHLFLNELYDDLGFDHTSAGAVTGWVYKSEEGDGFIDFGIFDGDNALTIFDYVTGREGDIFIDFNVDGVIYDKI